MKTQYINLPKQTQEYLLKFLPLTKRVGDPRPNIISLSYTDSEPHYQEKVLNLRWSLGASFKTLSLVAKLGKERAIKEWGDLYRIQSSEDFAKKLAWFDHIGTDLEVRQPDFKTGVKELYKKLTAIEKVAVPGQKQPWRIPTLIIRLDGERGDFHSFSLFIYDEREQAFKRYCKRTNE